VQNTFFGLTVARLGHCNWELSRANINATTNNYNVCQKRPPFYFSNNSARKGNASKIGSRAGYVESVK